MKKVFRIVLSLAICLLFSSMSYASPNGVARELARLTKQQIQKQYGQQFPIKMNDKTSLANITADGQYIIYDYLYDDNSKKYTPEILALYVQMTFDQRSCKNHDFVSLFQDNDLQFVYRYTFNDKKNMFVSFRIDEVCN
ncbi:MULTISPECIES: hypothetical protein [unclassified Gilliamella]|jgi:hypothetical protein|uniref:hypothetical protein n=1 Tax=unclassified Gilliamella TaxID=2685620 RepID=UPI00080E9EBF|nr:hypothetical protein [Gilliamella apicola]OCG35560.1 hypothetical protein A9G32_06975 [Gilliamella apicola]OCG50378.1 hypothetical protein A9G26_07005 [Gilliamella apicola]OCG51054.1 hypothetical protein A9G27_00920 [Gilliamella apicola]